MIHSWVNLEPGAQLAPDERGFTYGDGLFETLRYGFGTFQLLDAHLQRMRGGADRLGIEVPAQLLQQQLALAGDYLAGEGLDEACLRLALSRGRGGRGYRPTEGVEPTLVATLYATSPWSREPESVNAIHCQLRLAPQPLLAGIKHSNRLEQVLAAHELVAAEVDEGILSNTRDEVVCAVSSNLFAWDGSSWLTPPISDCGIAGTMRSFLLEQVAPRHNIPMREQVLKREELAGMRALCGSNSLLGIRAIKSLGGTPLPDREAVGDLRGALLETMAAL